MTTTSPTPWTLERETRTPGWILFIRDANGQVVTYKNTYRPHSARDEANFRMIVEAVNSASEEK